MDDRARRLYRWVLDTIEPGKENAAPRIITSKSGERTRAFLYLCRLVGVDARLGLIEDRLSPPPNGPFSEAGKFSAPAVRVATEHGPRWMVLGNRFAPYGFLPSSLRGQPAVLITLPKPQTTPKPPPLVYETTPVKGAADGIAHDGKAKLKADGRARLDLVQEYRGKYAIMLRSILNNVPTARHKDVIEARLIGMSLPGGRISKLTIDGLDQLDEPVVLRMSLDVPNFAKNHGLV